LGARDGLAAGAAMLKVGAAAERRGPRGNQMRRINGSRQSTCCVTSTERWMTPMKTTEQRARTTDIRVSISDEDIWGLLVSAFEGGSNYWIRSAEVATKPSKVAVDLARVPLNGGALRFEIDNDDAVPLRLLDRAAIVHGLELMAKLQPQHFADVIRDSSDADTGDVFLQICLFDELVFG